MGPKKEEDAEGEDERTPGCMELKKKPGDLDMGKVASSNLPGELDKEGTRRRREADLDPWLHSSLRSLFPLLPLSTPSLRLTRLTRLPTLR